MGHNSFRFFICCIGLFCWTSALGFENDDSSSFSATTKPLVQHPGSTPYKTLLSIDGGGVRVIFSAVVLVEVEQSIKRHLLKNPHLLPPKASFTSVDDFDISLADYFDCVTGTSAGTWLALYVGSKNGHKEFRDFLEKPDVVLRYGAVSHRSAEAIRVFIKEFGGVIYPNDLIDFSAGVPFDLLNPNAPGVSSALYDLKGLEFSFEALFGNNTLEDLDTSVLVPTQDLNTGLAVFFVRNAFKNPPTTSSAVLNRRSRPHEVQADTNRFSSDFVFHEGRNYFLKDVATAASTPIALSPPKSMHQINNDTEEYLAIDGIGVTESSVLSASFFVASETGLHSFEKIAILSVGTGVAETDFSSYKDAGALRWSQNFVTLALFLSGGQESHNALLDYLYYSNPNSKPHQFLRVQRTEPVTSTEGMALSVINEVSLAGVFEKLAAETSEEYRDSIDDFVKQFIFGERS